MNSKVIASLIVILGTSWLGTPGLAYGQSKWLHETHDHYQNYQRTTYRKSKYAVNDFDIPSVLRPNVAVRGADQLNQHNECMIGCTKSESGNDAFGPPVLFESNSICSSDDFISPITNPIYFEDPRNLSEVRIFFLNQKIPLTAGCEEIQVYSTQFRATISDNLSLIVNKAGYVVGNNSFSGDGWLDFSVGLKRNLIQDVYLGRFLSAGFTFESPTGQTSARQGNGDGEIRMFLANAQRVGRCSHWISGLGARVPMNSTDESQSLYWSNHFDYQVRHKTYLVAELNWFHWLKSGEDGCLCFEGLDLFNFGTPGVAGNDIVTTAFGLKRKFGCDSEFGFAFEFPLTERRDILDNRVTVDWIHRF